MAANVDAIIREGIAAYKAGRKEEARAVLLRAVEVDQYNEQAWLWLSAVVDTPEDQRTCLENVLAINPDNERARTGLNVINEQAAPPPPPAPTPARGNDFPTSVEWGAPAEPLAFTGSTVSPEISDDEYDDWVANLNLPSSSPTPLSTDAFTSADPFGGAFFENDEEVDDLLDTSFNASSNSPFSTLDFETVFGSPEAAATMPPPPPPAPPSTSSPSGLMSPGRDTDDSFDDLDLRGTGVFAQFEDDDFSETDLESLNADELFHYIPMDVQPTRLPGTRERYPLMLMLGLVLLVLLNAGVLALLVYRLL